MLLLCVLLVVFVILKSVFNVFSLDVVLICIVVEYVDVLGVFFVDMKVEVDWLYVNYVWEDFCLLFVGFVVIVLLLFVVLCLL